MYFDRTSYYHNFIADMNMGRMVQKYVVYMIFCIFFFFTGVFLPNKISSSW